MSESVRYNPVAFCECGARGLVFDTRHRDTFMWRRHKCTKKKCGKRWTTVEHRVEAPRGGFATERAFRMEVAVHEREALGAAIVTAVTGILFPGNGSDAAQHQEQGKK